MSENRERGKGKLDEIGGNIKQGIGKVTGNEQMQAEGRAQELAGEGRQGAAKAAGTAKGMGEEAKGNIKQGLGDLTDNERMEAEGHADELQDACIQAHRGTFPVGIMCRVLSVSRAGFYAAQRVSAGGPATPAPHPHVSSNHLSPGSDRRRRS